MNPGLLFGDRIKANRVIERGNGIILAPLLSDCLRGMVSNGLIFSDPVEHKDSCYSALSFGSDCEYAVKARVSTDSCQKLAPDINGNCLSSYLVRVAVHSGGTVGYWNSFMIYGIFELENKQKVVAPLKQFEYLNDGYDFIDTIKNR